MTGSDSELVARIGQAKVVAKSLRNHARNVAAYMADLEQWLDEHPPAQEAQGNERNGNARSRAVV